MERVNFGLMNGHEGFIATEGAGGDARRDTVKLQ